MKYFIGFLICLTLFLAWFYRYYNNISDGYNIHNRVDNQSLVFQSKTIKPGLNQIEFTESQNVETKKSIAKVSLDDVQDLINSIHF